MIKIKKLNVVYNIPEHDLPYWKQKGFNEVIPVMVEPIENKVVVETKEVDDESEVEEVKVNYWTMKNEELLEIAINKGISLTGDESRKEIIEKIK